MSERRPTQEQQAAIAAPGQVLVSASAGSGKTFVMIEKMISLILAGEAEVSSVLAVTFTKLAAAEMKERLRAALVRSVNGTQSPAVRARLREQISEIGTADVCTLHSFCTGLLRRRFYEADVEANFRVLDDAEAKKLRRRALQQTIEYLLEQKSAAFSALGAAFAGSRGFDALGKIVLEGYEKMRSRPDYIAFLRALPARYGEEGFESLAAELQGEVALRAARLSKSAAALEGEMQPYLEQGLFGGAHIAFLQERKALAERLCAAPDIFASAAILAETKLSSKPRADKARKGGGPAAALDEKLKTLKPQIEKLAKFAAPFASREEELARFLSSGKTAEGLCEALIAFDGFYAAAKRRAGGLDFADLEHGCLRLLENEAVRAEVNARYTHVFVDEYQDVNPVQDRILTRLGGKNVFMVGDPKQSIYGFRGCSAAFFTQKFEQLSAEGRALTLNGNFRSCFAVLDAVNKLFTRCMTRESCSIDYAATSVITAGDAARQGSPARPLGKVCAEFVPPPEKQAPPARGVYSVAEHLGEGEGEASAEGELIAELVLQEAASMRYDPAEGKEVPNRLQDIVVLMRSGTEHTRRVIRSLVGRGIPVAAAAEVDLCSYPEVRAMLAILQFLDNGGQEIPLAAALKSAMGGLTDEDLAAIRLSAKKDEKGEESFAAACRRLAAEGGGLGQKLAAFYARAERYRLRMQVHGAAELMAYILADTGMEAQQLALPCGAERVRRLSRLIAAAGSAAVHEFLEQVKVSGELGYTESGGENAVRVMTMHASKGLEFPVVIVGGLNKPFAGDQSPVLFDDEWGFALKAYDPSSHTAAETILRAAASRRAARRRSEDEMRLLYVALTRAKSSLHLVFSKEQPFDEAALTEAKSFADFIDLTLLQNNYAPVAGTAPAPAGERVISGCDEAAKAAVLARYALPYAYQSSTLLPVKTSPSAILQALRAEEPAVGGEEYASDADAAHGTAYHAFLERADFSAPVEEEIARVCALLPPQQAALLDAGRLRAVLQMPVFASLSGYTLGREREFLMFLPARQLFETDAEDEVLVQGVIDLLAARGGECIVIDYKYSSHGPEQLLARYAPQLKIYAAAARRGGASKVRAYIVNILQCYTLPVPQEILEER